MRNRGFTLFQMLLILGILALLIIIAVFVAKPAKILEKSRDSQRSADVSNLARAINLYLADNHDFSNLSGPFSSIDPGFSSDEARKKNDGTGWLPMNFTLVSTGAPLGSLPLDPINSAEYHYRVGVNPGNKTYEINGTFENLENISKASGDGGNNAGAFEVGTDLTIL